MGNALALAGIDCKDEARKVVGKITLTSMSSPNAGIGRELASEVSALANLAGFISIVSMYESI